VNTQLDGHPYFKIKRRLAVGGMGELYLVESTGHPDITDGYLVAKAPPMEDFINDEVREMLEEEGRLALRLQHENIVETFAVEDENEAPPMIVMEYLHGPSLSDVLGRARKIDRKVPIPFILQVLRETAYGLHFAHSLKNQMGHAIGLIHRDVSPANILITAHGDVKLIDFGIAKSKDSQVKTKTGTLKGKLSYMSPEQITGSKPNKQSDIWALGVVLWESLTISRLFTGNTFQSVIQQVLHFPLVPPSTVNSRVASDVDELSLKLLERDKDFRFKDCKEIAGAIDAIDINWTRADTMGLIHDLFPRKTKRWLHEGKRLAKHRFRGESPSGLIDGGVFEMVTQEFDEEEGVTRTSSVVPFDWSSFVAEPTITKSHNELSFIKTQTSESQTIPSKIPISISREIEAEVNSPLDFEEDPWAELTSTREIIKPQSSNPSAVLGFDEIRTMTRTDDFKTLRSQESLHNYDFDEDSNEETQLMESNHTQTELVIHPAHTAPDEIQPTVFNKYLVPIGFLFALLGALAFYFLTT